MFSGIREKIRSFARRDIILEFFGSSKKRRALICVGLLCALAHGAMFPLLGILIGNQIGEQIYADQQRNANSTVFYRTNTNAYLLQGLLLTLAQVVLCFGERIFPLIPALYTVRSLEDKLVKNILRLPLAQIERMKIGEIMALLHDNMQEIGQAAQSIASMVFVVSVAIMGYGFAFGLNWKIAVLMLYLVPAFVVLRRKSKLYFTKYRKEEQSSFNKASGIVSETLSSIRTVLCFNAQKIFIEKFGQEVTLGSKAFYFRSLVETVTFCTQTFLVYSAYAWCFWCGSQIVGDDYKARGNIYALLLIIVNAAQQLHGLDMHLKKFQSALVSYNAIEPIIRHHQIKHKKSMAGKTSVLHGKVTFNNISFAYEGRENEKVLENLNLEIAEGEHIAIVGCSGAGKSTLVGLLLQLFEPSSGKILFDNIPAKAFNLHALRVQMGYVAQEPGLLDTSIKYNIMLGNEEATEEEVMQASHAANVHLFARDFEQYLDTPVGPGGSSLSGGQRQRVAIARALLRDPKIMIFDEATSALDTYNENIVLDAINKSCINRTTITVTHRMHVALNADRVVVLEKGEIVEQGTPQELIEKQEKFFTMLQQEQLDTAPQVEEENGGRKRRRTVSFRVEEEIQAKKSSIWRVRSLSVSSIKNSIMSAKKRKWNSLGKLFKPDDNKSVCYLLISMLISLVDAASFPLHAFLIATALNSLTLETGLMKAKITKTSLYLLVLGAVVCLAHLLKGLFMARFARQTSIALRNRLFGAILGNEFMDYFEREGNSASILSMRLTKDVANVQKLMSEQVLNIFSSAISALTCWIISFSISPAYAGCCFILFPFKQVLHFIKIHVNLNNQAILKPLEERIAQFVTDIITNVETVYAFSLQRQAFDQYTNLMHYVQKRRKYEAYVNSIIYGLQNAMDFIFFVLGFVLGAVFVESYGLSTYHMWLIYFLNLKANQKLVYLSTSIAEFSNSYFSIGVLLDTYRAAISDRTPRTTPQPETRISSGHVQFISTCFHYESRPQVETLYKICLDIKSGQMVALVGRSGMGKSTIASLLQRLYDCTSGNIVKKFKPLSFCHNFLFPTIDGQDIAEMDLHYLRTQVVMVPQQPTLFDCTIADNIKMGLDVSQEAIEQAASQANAHDFIVNLSHGYETIVGERGVQLSGGQRQRIAIARALIRQPAVLILDEPASALDYNSEKAVNDALAQVQHNFSCLLITHRLSSAQNADEIIVIDKGKIKERGKHDDLMRNRQYYWKLVNARMS